MGRWLSYQHDVTSGDEVQQWKLIVTWNLDHVKLRSRVYASRFSVSESGGIGISCFENPSLSVVYPDADKAPVILSNDTIYRSATFVKISGKEYLAAACREDWDVYTSGTQKQKHLRKPLTRNYPRTNNTNT